MNPLNQAGLKTDKNTLEKAFLRDPILETLSKYTGEKPYEELAVMEAKHLMSGDISATCLGTLPLSRAVPELVLVVF